MKKINAILLFSLALNFAQATEFDYYEFMQTLEKEKEIENKSSFNFDFFNEEKDDKELSYAEKKYGKAIKYQTYDEIKAERLKRNTLLMIGAERRDILITDKSDGYIYSEEIGSVVGVDETKFTKSYETEWNTTIYFSTLLDLKYFNIQEDVKNTYLGVGFGKYIDVDLQWDLTDGRTTDFYAMAGPLIRLNLQDEDRLLTGGLQATLGYFITENVSIFYSAKYTGETFISEDSQYLIEKDGLSRKIDQFFYIGTKF